MITDDYGNLISTPRSQTIHDRLDKMEARLADGDTLMSEIKADLAANTRATKDLGSSVQEVIEFFATMKGAFKALDMLGKLAKPLGYILAFLAAATSFWAAIKSGHIGPRS